MKFLIVIALALIAVVAAIPNESAYASYHGQHQQQAEIQHKQQAQVQGRANYHSQVNKEKEYQHQEIDSAAKGRDMGLDDDMMSADHLDRQKKSYGSGGVKCGKAVVVGCGPIVQKVKCKGGYGGHKGAYSENVEQYAYPEAEYETGPYIQYV